MKEVINQNENEDNDNESNENGMTIFNGQCV